MFREDKLRTDLNSETHLNLYPLPNLPKYQKQNINCEAAPQKYCFENNSVR